MHDLAEYSSFLDKLIKAKRGMFHRVTDPIHLHPFTLSECKQFYDSHKIRLSQYDIAESYMVFGGIPYYMDFFPLVTNRGLSYNEYSSVFQSVITLDDLFG